MSIPRWRKNDKVRLRKALSYDDGTTFPKGTEGVILGPSSLITGYLVRFPIVGDQEHFHKGRTSDINLIESELEDCAKSLLGV